jgi:hypothetical protein
MHAKRCADRAWPHKPGVYFTHLSDGCEYRQSKVLFARLLGVGASDHLRPVRDRLLAVEGALQQQQPASRQVLHGLMQSQKEPAAWRRPAQEHGCDRRLDRRGGLWHPCGCASNR